MAFCYLCGRKAERDPSRWARSLKLLVVSNLHYSLKQFDWPLDRAAQHGLLVIAGDLLDLAGHIHNSPFYDSGSWHDRIGDTLVFNPGREMSFVPTCISIDFDAMRATWESSEGEEEIEIPASGAYSPAG